VTFALKFGPTEKIQDKEAPF